MDAITSFRKYLQVRPDDAEAHFNLGNALYNHGDQELAIDAYHDTIRLKPDMARAHYNLGMALIGQRDFKAAKAEFLEANKLDSTLTAPKGLPEK